MKPRNPWPRWSALALPVAGVVAVAAVAYAGDGHDHAEHKDHKSPLAAAPEQAEVGRLAPDFTLTDLEGNEHTLSQYVADGKIVVLEWFNPDCPFVKKVHLNHKTMVETYQEFAEKNIVWLAINSGAPGKQGAGLERNVKAKADYEMPYPILLDEAGKVGMAYGAKTTPTVFVINSAGKLVYDGPLDNLPNPMEVGDVNYVKDVLGACCNGKDVDPMKVKSYGCSVKYAS